MVERRNPTQMFTGETVAAKLAIYRWIRELVNWLEKETKAELADEMKPGDRQQALLAGRNVGTINMINGRRQLAPTDEDQFAQWVAERWPDQTVMRVRPEFIEELKKQAFKFGVLIDDDGEVCPCVEVRIGEPTLNSKIDLELTAEIMQERLREGHTVADVIRELTDGTTK